MFEYRLWFKVLEWQLFVSYIQLVVRMLFDRVLSADCIIFQADIGKIVAMVVPLFLFLVGF